MPNLKSNLISTLVVIVVIFVSVAIYRNNLARELEGGIELTLTETSQQQNYILTEDMDSKILALESIATQLTDLHDENFIETISPEFLSLISIVESQLNFQRIGLSDAAGNAVLVNGEIEYVGNCEFFSDIKHDGIEISGLTKSVVDDSDCIYLSTEIESKSGELMGYVLAEVGTNTIQELMLPSFNNEGVGIVLDSLGYVITVSENGDDITAGINALEYLDFYILDDGFTPDELTLLLQSENREGFMAYKLNGVDMIFKYMPIGETPWTYLLSVPKNEVSIHSDQVIVDTSLIFTEILIIVFIILYRSNRLSKKHLKEVEQYAYHDELTGLINEKKFKTLMRIILLNNSDKQYCVVKFDIAGFKVLNKICDYNVGNTAIKLIADRVQQTITSIDDTLICRVVADEFLVFAPYVDTQEVIPILKEYENAINDELYKICKRTMRFRYSRYIIPIGETNVNDIVDTIELTHNTHKGLNFEGIYHYEDNLKMQLLHATYIVDIMKDALINEEFQVYLQPKIDIETRKVSGGEALVRWQRPDGKFIFPDQFISIFEQEGFIVELDKYMLKKVCAIIQRYISKGYAIPISINFSRLHMLNKNFANEISETVDSFGIPHELIEIEMTETSMMEDTQSFKDLFADLHSRGFKLSMDDFGAGYSSFDLLIELNFDVIKLDKSLLTQTAVTGNRKLVIEAIINMANELNLTTVCEGVETIEQVKFLENANCDIAQGYFFSRPIPNEDFDALLDKIY